MYIYHIFPIYIHPNLNFVNEPVRLLLFTKSRELMHYVVKYEEGSWSLFTKARYLLNRGLGVYIYVPMQVYLTHVRPEEWTKAIRAEKIVLFKIANFPSDKMALNTEAAHHLLKKEKDLVVLQKLMKIIMRRNGLAVMNFAN